MWGWGVGGGLQYAKMQLNSSLPQRYCSKQTIEKGKKTWNLSIRVREYFWSSTLLDKFRKSLKKYIIYLYDIF